MRGRAVALISVAALALAPAATAQTPDQVYGQDTPAGTEYQLPHERARDQAGSGSVMSARAASPASEAPLFGVGIASAPRPDAGSDSGDAAGGGGSSDRGQPRDRSRTPSGGASASRSGAVATARSSDLAVVAVAAPVAGVLLLGTLIGLGVRRTRRRR